MDIPVSKVRKVLKIAQEPISLETPIGEEEDSHLGDFIEDRQVVSPAEAVINLNLKEQTESVLKTLTPREEKVIKMRFGVGDGSEHTLEEVGQSFAVTRERIRQIEAKALRKLRHPSRSRKLRAFLEGIGMSGRSSANVVISTSASSLMASHRVLSPVASSARACILSSSAGSMRAKRRIIFSSDNGVKPGSFPHAAQQIAASGNRPASSTMST
jgi:hypothetical protein